MFTILKKRIEKYCFTEKINTKGYYKIHAKAEYAIIFISDKKL